MSRLIGVLLVIFLVPACIENDRPIPFCDVANPVEELSWLNTIILDLEESIAEGDNHFFDTFWFRQFTYDDTQYFMQGDCCASCFRAPIYFNCLGDTITFEVPTEELDSFVQTANSGEIIWQGGACNF